MIEMSSINRRLDGHEQGLVLLFFLRSLKRIQKKLVHFAQYVLGSFGHTKTMVWSSELFRICNLYAVFQGEPV